MGNESKMRVLLATDGSKNAQRATEWLTRLPLASTTSVLVVSVAPLPVLSTGIPSARDLDHHVLKVAGLLREHDDTVGRLGG